VSSVAVKAKSLGLKLSKLHANLTDFSPVSLA